MRYVGTVTASMGSSNAHELLTHFGCEEVIETFQDEWYAVPTRSRHETLVAQQLTADRIPHWLPLVERRRRWSDRYRTVAMPLFPGYLFINLNIERHLAVRQKRGVVRIVGSNNTAVPVPQHEIVAVWRLVRSDLQYDPFPHLVAGTIVEVRRGPLRGHRGILERKKNRHRLILSISLIGQGVAVEI